MKLSHRRKTLLAITTTLVLLMSSGVTSAFTQYATFSDIGPRIPFTGSGTFNSPIAVCLDSSYDGQTTWDLSRSWHARAYGAMGEWNNLSSEAHFQMYNSCPSDRSYVKLKSTYSCMSCDWEGQFAVQSSFSCNVTNEYQNWHTCYNWATITMNKDDYVFWSGFDASQCCPIGTRDLQSVLTHVFGYALGLGDSLEDNDTMAMPFIEPEARTIETTFSSCQLDPGHDKWGIARLHGCSH